MWRMGQFFRFLALLLLWAGLGLCSFFIATEILANPAASTVWKFASVCAIALMAVAAIATIYDLVRYGSSAAVLGGGQPRSIGQLVTQDGRRKIAVRSLVLQGKPVTILKFDMLYNDGGVVTPYVLSKSELGALIDLLERSRGELPQDD